MTAQLTTPPKPSGTMTAAMAAKDIRRFILKIDMNGPTPDQKNPHYSGLEKCWNWKAGLYKNGYGSFSIGGNNKYSHRVSWMIHKGLIPHGMCVLHRCDNRKCCNPSHLFLGTVRDNALDMVMKGRESNGSLINQATRPRGERHGNAKLKEHQVREIRSLAEHGATQRSIAERAGITQSVVSRVVRREIWRHVA